MCVCIKGERSFGEIVERLYECSQLIPLTIKISFRIVLGSTTNLAHIASGAKSGLKYVNL